MIVRFFHHGDGSGQSAVDYLMAEEVPKFDVHRNRIKGATVKRDPLPECLDGDPEQMALLIDSDHRKWRYTSLVVAFADDDAPSDDEQREVMASFETAAFAGLATDQPKTLWVRHTHMGNVELHCLVLRRELHNGRALNIAPPGAERYFNAWRDYWNAKMGWADPEAVEHHRPLRDVIECKDRSELRSFINELVIGEIEKGAIADHADVRAYLQTLEEDGLEIKPPTEKQIARRKAKGKARLPDKRITLREVGSTTSVGTLRLEDRIYHEQWTAAEYFAGQAAKESLGAGQRKSRATPDRVEELRRAMEDAIGDRAEKNRDRYGGSSPNGTTNAQPDESSNRDGNVGARNDDTESGEGLELHTLEDGDAERLLIDVGGLRRSARRLRNIWRDEGGTTSGGGTANSAGSERESGDARHRRPWDHHTPSTRHRDDGLPDWNTDGPHLYQEALEEYEDERWSNAIRERITALRRNFAEADRAIRQTFDQLWRGVEELRARIRQLSKKTKIETNKNNEVAHLNDPKVNLIDLEHSRALRSFDL
ncbi:hypothetical protein [Sulfitobacter geojensis]|uniref:hypothetical protein n=1 Tax=Sulfitobacter geojensis TaxID=1342299 RepID=UPI00249161F1|nr:hypothetical protein [Sulfitobacter geojensis]